jgi:tetratricopeptide (TPR) repeat protein
MGIRNTLEELSIPLSETSLPSKDVQILAENWLPSLRLWHIPYRRNLFFTGREDTLQNLYDALRVNRTIALSQPQAISGLGGIGKTQTALEYAYRYCNDYRVILWANADTRETLVSDLIIIAELLKLPEKNEQDQTLVVHAIKRWLQTHSSWLLILDNVEHLEVGSELIPQFVKGHILITTRLQALGMLASQVEIDKMEPEMATLFLLRRARIIASNAPLTDASEVYQSQAQEIVQIMDGLPLALDQAGSYIEETRCSLLHYLDLYQARRAELLKRRGESVFDHPQSVTTTFLLSFERIQQSHLAAAELLRFFAFLYPSDIPEEILVKGSLDLGPVVQPVAADPFALDEAIAELLKYSLLRRDSDAQTLTMHRLVQTVFSDMMDKNTQRQWAERAVRAVNRAFPDVEFGTWKICQHYLPQAEVSAGLIQQWNMEFTEAARLLYQAANYLHARSQLTQALPLYQQALTIREKVLGLNHPDTAASLGQLGVLYRTQGNFEQAERFQEQAMEIYLKTRGLKDRDTAFSLHNLAALYRIQHKYAKGESFAQQALDIRKEVLGLEHPDTTFSLIRLAELYKDQHKYDQAESLFQQAVVIRENLCSAHHAAYRGIDPHRLCSRVERQESAWRQG